MPTDEGTSDDAIPILTAPPEWFRATKRPERRAGIPITMTTHDTVAIEVQLWRLAELGIDFVDGQDSMHCVGDGHTRTALQELTGPTFKWTAIASAR